jgi:hypothetical protein
MLRFRYGLPEKIGGWQSLVNATLIGAARAQHTWTDLLGRKYASLGTNKILAIYFEGDFYDITPIDTDKDQTACNYNYYQWFSNRYYYHSRST